jgi:hypothetical protein
VVNPFPTGSFTLQETPSFAWRTNAQNKLPMGGTPTNFEIRTNLWDAVSSYLPGESPSVSLHFVVGLIRTQEFACKTPLP